MSVEAAGVDPRRHDLVPAGEHRADHEIRCVALRTRELRDLGSGGLLDARVDERRSVAREDDAGSLDDAHLHARLDIQRPVTGEALAVERGADLRPVARHELLRDQLAEPPRVAVDERHESTGRRHGAADRELVAEGASVHRDRRCGNRLLEAATEIAEAPDRAAELVRGWSGHAQRLPARPRPTSHDASSPRPRRRPRPSCRAARDACSGG